MSASTEEPITLYRYDFDQNGKTDPIISYYYQGEETVINSKDELVAQLPMMNKKFLSYRSFAEASFMELLGRENLAKAVKNYVYNLNSSYFLNQGNFNFVTRALPFQAQSSSVHDIFMEDFDQDGYQDMLLVGNTFELNTQIGRLDALHGLILKNEGSGFVYYDNLNLIGAARQAKKITIGDQNHILIGINNDSLAVVQYDLIK